VTGGAGLAGVVTAALAAWRDRALCAEVDPELFFPETGESPDPAKRVCRACEVRAECLDYALDRGERFGVWGGLSVGERLDLARQRRPGAAAGDAARSDAA
jgi:WhiB family redox-sensing transcriptional regulator